MKWRTPEQIAKDHLLPSRMLDLVRDGAPVDATMTSRRFDLAVGRACNSVCLSALRHGWSYPELAALVFADRTRKHPGSELGRQLHRRDGQPRAHADAEKRLRRQWDDAGRFIAANPPPWTLPGMTERAERVALAAEALAADAEQDLPDPIRGVLVYAAGEARERALTRVPLPWRTVRKAIGLGPQPMRNTLTEMTARGLLRLDVPGRGCKGCPANLYTLLPELADAAEPIPKRLVVLGMDSLDRDPPQTGHPLPPATEHGSTTNQARPTEETGMRTLTLPDGSIVVLRDGHTLADVAAALARELGHRDTVTAAAAPEEPLPENVHVLRPAQP